MTEPYINSRKSDKKENVMDDITHGQWSKNHYNNKNDDDSDHMYDYNMVENDDILDPYTMPRSFRKIAKKLSRRL
jgi:hypothetical protein